MQPIDSICDADPSIGSIAILLFDSHLCVLFYRALFVTPVAPTLTFVPHTPSPVFVPLGSLSGLNCQRDSLFRFVANVYSKISTNFSDRLCCGSASSVALRWQMFPFLFLSFHLFIPFLFEHHPFLYTCFYRFSVSFSFFFSVFPGATCFVTR